MAKHRNRASDAQRTAVQQALDEAFAEGRLDHFEHFERIRTATKAKYIDELRPLVADLRGGEDDLGLDGDDDDNAPTDAAYPGWAARRREDLSHAKRRWTIGIAGAVAEGAVTFHVEAGEAFVPRLFAELGVAITSVSVSRPTLDDVFIRHTGSTLRDAESGDRGDPAAALMRALAGGKR